jgi:tetratricopeptide (TPR) repeat protein
MHIRKNSASARGLWSVLMSLALLASPLLAAADPIDTAQKLWLTGQREQAVAGVERALSNSPDDLKLRFTLGVMRMELGEHAAALTLFTGLTRDFPDLADPYNNLAVIYAGQGLLDEAHRALEQALLLQPNHAQAQENLGDLLLQLALRAYQRAQASLAQPSGNLALKLSRTQALVQIQSPSQAQPSPGAQPR